MAEEEVEVVVVAAAEIWSCCILGMVVVVEAVAAEIWSCCVPGMEVVEENSKDT